MLQSLSSTLAENGFDLIFSNRNSPAAERHILGQAFDGSVRGVVVLGAASLPAYGRRCLIDAEIPVVSLLLDRSAAGIPSVITNDREAMQEGALHLIALEHRSFLYVAGEAGNYHEVEALLRPARCLGDGGALQKGRHPARGSLGFNEGLQNGVEAAHAFLGMERRPTAVICCADDAAISFIATVRSHGVTVPGDVSVVGFDGAAIGAFCDPPLTTAGAADPRYRRPRRGDHAAARGRGLRRPAAEDNAVKPAAPAGQHGRCQRSAGKPRRPLPGPGRPAETALVVAVEGRRVGEAVVPDHAGHLLSAGLDDPMRRLQPRGHDHVVQRGAARR